MTALGNLSSKCGIPHQHASPFTGTLLACAYGVAMVFRSSPSELFCYAEALQRHRAFLCAAGNTRDNYMGHSAMHFVPLMPLTPIIFSRLFLRSTMYLYIYVL